MCADRNETQRNIEIATTAMMASVSAALRDCGRRNAGTPFEIASTPVSAVEPEAKARRTMNRATGPALLATSAIGVTGAAAGQPPTHRTRPTPTMNRIDAMNAQV